MIANHMSLILPTWTGGRSPTQCFATLKKKMETAFLPTKHLRVHMNSFKRVRAFQIEFEFGSVGF